MVFSRLYASIMGKFATISNLTPNWVRKTTIYTILSTSFLFKLVTALAVGILFIVWGAAAFWNTFRGEFIAGDSQSTRAIMERVFHLLPAWVWLFIFLTIIVISCVEYFGKEIRVLNEKNDSILKIISRIEGHSGVIDIIAARDFLHAEKIRLDNLVKEANQKWSAARAHFLQFATGKDDSLNTCRRWYGNEHTEMLGIFGRIQDLLKDAIGYQGILVTQPTPEQMRTPVNEDEAITNIDLKTEFRSNFYIHSSASTRINEAREILQRTIDIKNSHILQRGKETRA